MVEVIQIIPDGDLMTLKCSLGYSQTHWNLILAVQKMTRIPEVKIVGWFYFYFMVMVIL